MNSPGGPPARPYQGDGPGGPGDGTPGRPAKPKRAWVSAAVAVVVLAVAGVVAWLVIPGRSGDSSTAPSGASGAHPPAGSGATITGETVKQVLLDGAELTRMLHQPFKKTVDSPVYGDLDEMDDSSTPGACVGVVDAAQQSVYRSANVQSYAGETWIDRKPGDAGFNPFNAKIMFVREAVVAVPSGADARALFAEFSEQWKHCDGQAVNQEPDSSDPEHPHPLAGSEMHIADVRTTDTVLSASIVLDKNPKAPDTHAIGVQGNCLVEVLIAFTGAEDAIGSGDPRTSSVDVVRAMMDKAARLS